MVFGINDAHRAFGDCPEAQRLRVTLDTQTNDAIQCILAAGYRRGAIIDWRNHKSPTHLLVQVPTEKPDDAVKELINVLGLSRLSLMDTNVTVSIDKPVSEDVMDGLLASGLDLAGGQYGQKAASVNLDLQYDPTSSLSTVKGKRKAKGPPHDAFLSKGPSSVGPGVLKLIFRAPSAPESKTSSMTWPVEDIARFIGKKAADLTSADKSSTIVAIFPDDCVFSQPSTSRSKKSVSASLQDLWRRVMQYTGEVETDFSDDVDEGDERYEAPHKVVVMSQSDAAQLSSSHDWSTCDWNGKPQSDASESSPQGTSTKRAGGPADSDEEATGPVKRQRHG